MQESPAIEPSPTPVLSYTLQDVPVRRRFPIIREMMADGHPPFMRAVPTAERGNPEAPFDAGFVVRSAGDVVCCEHYSEAVSCTVRRAALPPRRSTTMAPFCSLTACGT